MDFFDSIRGLVGDSDSFFSDAIGVVSKVAKGMGGEAGGDSMSGLFGGGDTKSSQDLASTSRLLQQGFLDVGKGKASKTETGKGNGSVDIAELEKIWLQRMHMFTSGEMNG